MTNTQRPELSAVFDDMLSRNKKSFEELYRGGRSLTEPTAVTEAATGGKTGTSPRSNGELGVDSLVAHRLSERLGNDWRYEVAEQKREGDEAIVLCKLILGKSGAVRTQFGRAKIAHATVAGVSGGMRFQVGGMPAAPDEREAFRRAIEAALMNCAELI
jgi:hypothetical protein